MRIRCICVAIVALIAASCGGGDDEAAPTATTDAPAATDVSTTDAAETTAAPATTAAPTTTVAATTTAAPTTTLGGPEPLPETAVVAAMTQVYDFIGGVPDPALLPADPATVEARWYRAGPTYAVVFAGLDPSTQACPGNSILTANGFEFVSNAPLPGMSCDFPTIIESSPTQGVQLCGSQVGYLTLIPSDTVGQVFASVEAPAPEVTGVGFSGAANVADPAALPEIDPALLTC